MSEEMFSVKFSREEAIVLFEFLFRFGATNKLEIKDDAEGEVLNRMLCQLERVLAEPFAYNYDEVLEKARGKVRHQ